MPVRKWMRLHRKSHVTLFVWGAMALPFLLALAGLALAVHMLGEPGSAALLNETATFTLMFCFGVFSALLATWIHSR